MARKPEKYFSGIAHNTSLDNAKAFQFALFQLMDPKTSLDPVLNHFKPKVLNNAHVWSREAQSFFEPIWTTSIEDFELHMFPKKSPGVTCLRLFVTAILHKIDQNSKFLIE